MAGFTSNLARIWDRNILILKHMCPSLHTIASLALNTVIHLEDAGNFSGSDSSDCVGDLSRSGLYDDVTSASALGEVLIMLTALKTLHLTIILQGDLPLGVDRDHFLGPQWGRLSRTLSALCATLDLRTVSILVHIRALDYVSVETYLDDARELQRAIVERVYPTQFLELEKLQKEGSVTFSFKVEVSVGGSVGEYAGPHSLLV